MVVHMITSSMKHLLEKTGFFQLDNDLKQISVVQQIFGGLFSFENLDVLLQDEHAVTEEFLRKKLLQKNRGGLCYELNGTLHLVLKDLGFDVALAAATVWEDGWIIDRTHTINLYQKDDRLYLLDSGSGSNLYLCPLELDGEPVTSPAGTFRLRTETTERGSIVSEKLTDKGWVLRYAFYPTEVGWDDLDRIKDLIHHHPESPFNHKLLIAKTLENGTVSITNDRLRQKLDGKDFTIPFHHTDEMLMKIEQFASSSTYEAAVAYVKGLNN